MDDIEEDSRYPQKQYSVNQHSTYSTSSFRSTKRPIRNQSFPNNATYRNDDEYEDDEEENGVEFTDQDDAEDDEDEEFRNGYAGAIEPSDGSNRKPQKKRRLESLVSQYEFLPRNLPKESANYRNSVFEWTEHSSFVLLDVWGNRYLQLGRKSLRSEDWMEVAEKVSEMCKAEITDTECRNRLDILKKKYKKEKAKMEEMGGGYYGKWVFFKKMDMLLNFSPKQQSGLACGVDSGEYVFMNPRVYLNSSNALDEMRDSPGESETDGEDSDEGERNGDDGSSFRLLADSIQKFGEIYEKIEDSKRQQMMELEKMRMDFQKELELQKKQILERAQVEIAKIRQGDDDETDVSAEDVSE